MIEPTFTKNTQDTYLVTKECSVCKTIVYGTVEASDVWKWRNGTHVQDAFPYLSEPRRECLFISGICALCWNEMFGYEDE